MLLLELLAYLLKHMPATLIIGLFEDHNFANEIPTYYLFVWFEMI